MDLEKLVIAITNATPSVAMALIFGILYWQITKQLDKSEERRDRKDEAFMSFTASTILQIKVISDQLHETAKVNADANAQIIAKFGDIQCIKKTEKGI